MWEETGVPRENPRVRVGDHNTLLHTTTTDLEDRTRVVTAIRELFFFSRLKESSLTTMLPGHPYSVILCIGFYVFI